MRGRRGRHRPDRRDPTAARREVARRNGRANPVTVRRVEPWALRPGGKPGKRA